MARPFVLQHPSIEASRLALEPAALSSALAVIRATQQVAPSVDKKADAIYRPSFGMAPKHFRSADGKDVSLQEIPDRRGAGRPPLAVLTYIKGKVGTLFEFGYEKKGDKWRPTRVRTTLFDNQGKPHSIIDQTLPDFPTTSKDVAIIPPRILKAMGLAGSLLTQAALPDALHAATLDGEVSNACLSQWLAFSGAAALVATYASMLVSVGASCVSTLITCTAYLYVVAQYEAAVVLAAAAYVALNECRASHPCHGLDESIGVSGAPNALHVQAICEVSEGGNGGGSGGSGGGGFGEVDCHWEYWEISYDGGISWEPFGDPFEVCTMA
jgi:hypothetical protein